ncbi:MAG: 30S ribosomal protein S16 [Patescibacteria group bacterium]
MLKIRLQRTGRTNDPSYRVVVTEHTNSTKSGRAVEALGSYNPKSKERILNEERIKYWLSVGAQASGTMHNMLISLGIISGKKINVLPKKTVALKTGEQPTNTEAPTPEGVGVPTSPTPSENVGKDGKTEEAPVTPASA